VAVVGESLAATERSASTQKAVEDARREVLLKEYAEVGSTFRMLTDIRFKLLTLIPITAGAASLVLARAPDIASFAFSLFGLVVTLGLVTYKTRNDQLYDTLVGRAAALERQLGDPDGAFANRPQPWLHFTIVGKTKWSVEHRTAIASIYFASVGLWLYGVTSAAAHIAYVAVSESDPKSDPPEWLLLTAIGVAIVATGVGASVAKYRKCIRHRELNRQAKAAVVAVKEAMKSDKLAGIKDASEPLAQLASYEKEKVQARISYLSRDAATCFEQSIPLTPADWTAAQVVAYITDFSPEWLYDCATGRRESVEPCVPNPIVRFLLLIPVLRRRIQAADGGGLHRRQEGAAVHNSVKGSPD
jgi:hypothetical protein